MKNDLQKTRTYVNVNMSIVSLFQFLAATLMTLEKLSPSLDNIPKKENLLSLVKKSRIKVSINGLEPHNNK